jgi:hypothetical protein
MTETSTIFLIGFFIFLVSGVVLFIAYLYYIWRGKQMIRCTRCSVEERETLHVGWTPTRWIYPVLFLSLLLMALLYMSMFLSQGVSVKPNMLLVMWERWLILGLVALLYSVCLTYIMTIRSFDDQSFFLVFLYTLAHFFMLGAVLSQTLETRLLWLISSVVAFALAVLFYFYPINKFLACYHLPTCFQYYRWFFASLVLSYLYYVVIYFLAASNEFTAVLDFHGEVIAYLLGDILFAVVFPLIVVVTTFLNLRDTLAVRRVVVRQQQQADTMPAVTTMTTVTFRSNTIEALAQ